jgi:TonB family protein
MLRVCNLIHVLALCAGLSTTTGECWGQQPGDRKIINRVAPTYPALARRLHVIGAVKLEIVIRANGSVKSIKTVGGNPVLIEAATAAVGKWKFEAGAVETTEVVQLIFDPR